MNGLLIALMAACEAGPPSGFRPAWRVAGPDVGRHHSAPRHRAGLSRTHPARGCRAAIHRPTPLTDGQPQARATASGPLVAALRFRRGRGAEHRIPCLTSLRAGTS